VTLLQPWLVEILACPCDEHAPLNYDPAAADGAGELACTACDRVFRIDDGIPVLLLEEAEHRSAGDNSNTDSGNTDSSYTDSGAGEV